MKTEKVRYMKIIVKDSKIYEEPAGNQQTNFSKKLTK